MFRKLWFFDSFIYIYIYIYTYMYTYIWTPSMITLHLLHMRARGNNLHHHANLINCKTSLWPGMVVWDAHSLEWHLLMGSWAMYGIYLSQTQNLWLQLQLESPLSPSQRTCREKILLYLLSLQLSRVKSEQARPSEPTATLWLPSTSSILVIAKIHLLHVFLIWSTPFTSPYILPYNF